MLFLLQLHSLLFFRFSLDDKLGCHYWDNLVAQNKIKKLSYFSVALLWICHPNPYHTILYWHKVSYFDNWVKILMNCKDSRFKICHFVILSEKNLTRCNSITKPDIFWNFQIIFTILKKYQSCCFTKHTESGIFDNFIEWKKSIWEFVEGNLRSNSEYPRRVWIENLTQNGKLPSKNELTNKEYLKN